MIKAFLPVTIIVAWLTTTPAPLSAAPVLTIDQSEFDFGLVPQNSKVSHVFQLRNDGDDTLQITRVVPGCGCTQAPLKKSTLVPGESTELEIIFSTGHYNGPVTKRPRIETNESTPSRNITILTTVLERPDSTYPIQVRPYKLDISQFGQTVRDQLTFNISNVSDRDLALSLVSYPHDLVIVTVPERVGAGTSVQGSVRLTAAATQQSFETSITLELNDAAKTRFTIPIKRTVRSPDADEGVANAGKK